MTTPTERMLPLYQGMMTTFFDHRAADIVRSATATKRQNQPKYLSAAQHDDPERFAMPGYWVMYADVEGLGLNALLVFSDITSATNERSFASMLIPAVAVNNKLPLILSKVGQVGHLAANLSAIIFDYVARQKIGGTTLNFFIVEQLPVLSPGAFATMATIGGTSNWGEFIEARLIELAYTAWDMEPFARDLSDTGAPFKWNPERRFLLRAELDAAFFHLYGIAPDDVDYILDTFPIVKRKDEAAHGEYRTKRVILEVFDAMQRAIDTGEPYRTILDPPPGEGPRHPAKENPSG